MTPVIKLGIGLFACLALTLMLEARTRAQDASANTQAPVTASQSAATEAAKPAVHPSHEQLAKEMEAPECPCNMRPSSGMQEMGTKPGMSGMMGMGMQGMKMPMPGMQTQEMGMPGMGMMDMGMGMPMMHEHMMRMMARNPKLAGKMMQMRADMMRAIADVLTKYGKQMESGNWPSTQGKGGDD
ncbi:MAG: hypothetical protein ACLQU2_00710 [Candidatus Binataceae bacterium]